MDDEQCFSILNFMKTKLRTGLIAHLDLVIQILVQKFYFLDDFLYNQANDDKWKVAHMCYAWMLFFDTTYVPLACRCRPSCFNSWMKFIFSEYCFLGFVVIFNVVCLLACFSDLPIYLSFIWCTRELKLELHMMHLHWRAHTCSMMHIANCF